MPGDDMSRKIFELFALTAGLFISAHASENVNTPENRQFLKQQETLSQQLREKPDTQLQAAKFSCIICMSEMALRPSRTQTDTH